MARLFTGEKEMRKEDVIRILRIYSFGLNEVEIASTLGWDRRTTNNYLRELNAQQCIYKEGRLWFAED